VSRLDRLLNEVSPHGVEYRALGELGKIYGGLTGKSKPDFSDGNARFVSYINVFRNEYVDLNEDVYVTLRDGERQNRVAAGDILFTASSENAGDVGMSSVATTEPETPLYLNSFCFGFRLTEPGALLPGFSRHLFRSPGVRHQIVRTASGVTRFNVSKSRFLGVRIPVPPVEVQREIQATLDTFTELDAQLEAEMKGRRQLRLAIRDRFLSSGRTDGWPQIRLSEVATQHVEPVKVEAETSYVNLGVRWYGGGAFAREAHQGREIKAKTLYRVKANQFIYNRMFVTEGSFGLITPELAHGVVSNEFPVFDLDPERVLPEWLYIRFQDSNLVRRIANEAEGGTKSRRRWKEDRFADFQINLPPIDVQREIVRVLSACADVEANLNAERLKRRQQYEYYRNRLLTFEEAPA
jgi:type I restriction enzyme S subunit